MALRIARILVTTADKRDHHADRFDSHQIKTAGFHRDPY